MSTGSAIAVVPALSVFADEYHVSFTMATYLGTAQVNGETRSSMKRTNATQLIMLGVGPLFGFRFQIDLDAVLSRFCPQLVLACLIWDVH